MWKGEVQHVGDAKWKQGSHQMGGRVMLTVKQVAERLRISASLVYGWCEDHVLPHYRMGSKGKRGKILIEETVLDAFLKSRKVESGTGDTSALDLKHITLR